MSKISTYPILSTPTLNDLLIGTDVENLNETKNFSLSSIGTLIGQDYVPYIGATGNVDLGIYSIEGSAFIVNGGTASQFLKADGTLDSTFYVPQTRTITINSVGYDLSANRSWDLPTIDSLTTLGTSGAATYIGKVLNIPIYQAQGNYITQLSGEATALGPGNATVTLSNSAVISKVLTGLNITGGNVIATDTILQAFGKVQNQINGLTGGVTYQGTWNASTNTPFLQSSVGTKGYYYVVSVPGTTNLNGITDWQLGDWAIYNGTVWEKVDNTDAVVSVNGYTGAVMLTYSDVGAPPATRTLTINGVGYDLSLDRSWTVGNVRTDQTYADPSWITSLGWSKIINTPTTLAGYGITDGVSTARTLTINGVGYDLTADRTWSVGTVTSVGTTAPLTGGTITGSGTIGITQASAISDGYLSSTDWSTFNSKQNAITASAPLSLVAGTLSITQAGVSSDGYLSSTDWNTFNSKVGGSGTANYLPIWTSSSVLGNSSLSFSLDTLTVGYNSITGGAVSFTNIGLTPYTYSIQMNNFGSPRSTFHNYTDGIIVQAIASTQVSRMFDNGNFILGTGTTDTGHKLTISGDLYVNTIANAIVDTDRFIVSDGGIIKYRTGAQILTDIGAVSSVGLTMPAAFTVSNSPITSSGTIAVTGAGTAAQYIRGDGTLGDFPGGGGGGGASVSYYLNGSVNQGTFGGNTYYEMNKTPILGAGTDFSTSVNGYIAQFITDVGDPDALLIPGGNWNFETYFSASSGGGSPTFYIELYKYDGTTFTLIASNSTNPELIAFGTTVNPYFSALAVPETVLLATDRLAVRIYVSTSGRTITLHTENSNLCQVITTFTTGLTALNGLTKQVQYFSVGTSGTDFNISSSVATHTFNLPTASAVNRGALSSSDWSTFNAKQNALTLTTSGSSGPATLIGATLNIPDYGSALSGYVPYTGATTDVNIGLNVFKSNNSLLEGDGVSGGYIGFKQYSGTQGAGLGYSSISATGLTKFYFRAYQTGANVKSFNFDLSSITNLIERNYILPDADGTIALVGGSGVGTVTSVAALTLGTSGTDLSSTVANSTTTPVITLNVPTASATNRGALSAADWSTFNNKQNTITLTTTGTSGAATLVGSTLNIPQYQSVLTNPITGTGTTNYLPKFTGSTTIGNSLLIDDGNKINLTTTNTSISSLNIDSASLDHISMQSNRFHLIGSSNFHITNNAYYDLAFKYALTGVATKLTIQSDGSFVFDNSTSGTAGTAVTWINRFSINSSGAGTFSSSVTANGTIRITRPADTSQYIDIYPSGGEGFIDAVNSLAGTSQALIFRNGNSGGITERARITASGNLLVGTTTDNGARLQVSGTATISSNLTVGNGTTSVSLAINRGSSANSNGLRFQTASNNEWYIGSAATSTNTDLEIYNHNTATTNLRLAYSTGAATFSSNVAAGSTSSGAQINVFASSYGNNGLFNAYGTDNLIKLQMGALGTNEGFIFTGSGNKISFFSGGNLALTLNSNQTATFSGSVTASDVYATFGTGGYVSMRAGGAGAAGYFEIFKPGAVRLGYIGYNTTNILYQAENSANHIFQGGNVGIGTTSPSTALHVVSNDNSANRTSPYNVATITATSANAPYNGFGTGLVFAATHYNGLVYNGARIRNVLNDNSIVSLGNSIAFDVTSTRGGTLTEAMKIDYNGNVGIGTSSPTNGLLVINSTAANGVRFALESSGTMNGIVALGSNAISGLATTDLALWTRGVMAFETGASGEKMRITTGGNLLIGTTTDNGARLQVSGFARFDRGTLQFTLNPSYAGGNVYSQLQSTGALALATGGDNNRLYIDTSGNVGIGTSSPTHKLQILGGPDSGIRLTDSSGNTRALLNPSGAQHGEFSLYNSSGNITTYLGGPGSGVNYVMAQGGNFLIGTTTDVGARLQIVSSGVALNMATGNGQMANINSTNANGGYVTWQTSGTTIADLGTAQQVFGAGGNDTFGINGRGARALTFGTNNTERMRITSGGLIGIGTSSPSTLLHVNGSGTIGRFQSSVSYVDLSFINSTSSNGFIQYNGNNFNFFANSGSTPTMTITGGAPGNVLIGTTTDVGARLYVDGAFRTGTLTAGTQTAAVDWRLGNARGGAATNNALVRVQINGVLVDLLGNYV